MNIEEIMTNYRYSIKMIILAFALVFIASCDKDKDQDTNLILSNLKDEFHISLIEGLSPNGNELLLRVITVDPIDCENSTLDYSLEAGARSAILSINDIKQPNDNDCVLNPRPLATNVPLNNLPDGQTDIEINLRETIQNLGNIKHESAHYDLDMQTEYGIDIEQVKLYKIKQRTIWGYIGYKTEDSPLVDQFFTDLGDQTENGYFENGYYGHFTYEKDADDPITFEDNHELPYIQRFLLRLTTNTTDLKVLLDQYRQDYGDELELEIRTWEGEVL